jgi:hypothetical protein
MKGILLTLATLFAVTLSVSAQQKTGLIMWGPEANCKSSTLSITVKPVCDFVVLDGTGYRIVSHNGRTIAVTFATDGDYLLADVLVRNDSEDRFNVLPLRWAVFGYADESAADGGKPLLQSYAEDPKKIADKVERKARWANFFAGLGAALATSTTQTEGRISDTYGNAVTYTAETTQPDTAAQRQAAIEIDRRRQRSAADADSIMEWALKSNTVLPGARVAGRVYFKKGKAKFYEVYLPIGEVVYMFSVKRKK